MWKPDIYLFSTKEVKINKFLHDYKRLFKLFYGDGDRIGNMTIGVFGDILKVTRYVT